MHDNKCVYKLDDAPIETEETCYLIATVREQVSSELFRKLKEKHCNIVHVFDLDL